MLQQPKVAAPVEPAAETQKIVEPTPMTTMDAAL